jgi:hypothetical protein
MLELAGTAGRGRGSQLHGLVGVATPDPNGLILASLANSTRNRLTPDDHVAVPRDGPRIVNNTQRGTRNSLAASPSADGSRLAF